MEYLSKLEDWKRFGKNTSEIALNILYAEATEILPVHIPSHNSTREKQITLLMISNEENEKQGWHYLAVKKLSALLCRKTLNHDGDFYFLNCLHSLRKEKKLKSYEKAYED